MRTGVGKNVQETKKRNNEIINNIKQTLSKPTIVEAQRTLKIMEKLIDRIGLFLYLDSEFIIKFNQINNPQRLKLNKTLIQELSPEVLDLIVKEAKMQVEFKSFSQVQQQIKDGQIVEEEKIKQYERVKKDMAYSFKSLTRSLEKYPHDVEILKSLKMNAVPNTEAANIHEGLSNYKIIMQKTLATAAEEEESHTRLIEQLQLKIDSLEKTKVNCEKDLLKLRQDRAKHTEDKKEEMDKLKSQIKEVKNTKDRDLDDINKRSKEMADSLMKQYKKEQDSLKTLIAQERTKLTKLRQENSKAENKSKGDKHNNETHLMELILAYDSQMTKLSGTKKNSEKELKRVSDQLNNLKRHFLEIEEQRKRQQALLQADRLRKHRWELLEKKKGEAATKIKEAYRLWKNKNKKKKKKKK